MKPRTLQVTWDETGLSIATDPENMTMTEALGALDHARAMLHADIAHQLEERRQAEGET